MSNLHMGPPIKDVEMFGGGRGSKISMLQDIIWWGLGKSGLKFRHGGGGYQKWSKNLRRFLWTAPILNSRSTSLEF